MKGLNLMFHWRDNIYFGRTYDGSVRVVKLERTEQTTVWERSSGGMDPNGEIPARYAIYDFVIPSHEWASIVASVSKQGETARYNDAAKFHME